MSELTYTTLVADKTTEGSIKAWLNYSRVDAEGVLLDAQALIYRSLRVQQMRTTAAISLAKDASEAALPEDYLDPIRLQDTTHNAEIILRPEDEIEGDRHYDKSGNLTTGMPCWYGIYGDQLNFDVAASEACALRFLYYKRPALLGASNTTNFLTRLHPDVLRAACQAMAASYYNDTETYAREGQRAARLMDEANRADEIRSRRSTVY